MSASTDSGRVGERWLTLVPVLPSTQPWYAAASAASAPSRRELEDQHSRVLAQAVGDHLPYELVLRATELAAQLQRTP